MLEKLEQYTGFVIRAGAHKVSDADLPVRYWGECYRPVVTITAAGPCDEDLTEEIIEVPHGPICIDRQEAMLAATSFGRQVVDGKLRDGALSASSMARLLAPD